MKDNYFKTAAKISLVLLLICAVIAGVVAFVYSFTIDAYEANIAAQKRVAISSIFAENDGRSMRVASLPSFVNAVIKVCYKRLLRSIRLGTYHRIAVTLVPDGSLSHLRCQLPPGGSQ